MANDYFKPRDAHWRSRHWKYRSTNTPADSSTSMPLPSNSDYSKLEALLGIGPPRPVLTRQTRGQIFRSADEYDPQSRHNLMEPSCHENPLSVQRRLAHDTSFLFAGAGDNLTISFPGADGSMSVLRDIGPQYFNERCPLLAASFEPGSTGLRLHLEKLGSATAHPFLRYVYTGSYAVASIANGDIQDVPSSVLLHSQLYELGDLYDMPDLRSQAYVNILQQCEFGCSSPNTPIELCAAIRYIYQHLREHKDLLDTIVNHCTTNFLHNRLADDEDFQKLPTEFHRQLCKTCMNSDIDNEVACAIIQWSAQLKPTRVVRDDPLYMDSVHEDHDNASNDFARKRKRARPHEQDSTLSLALRPRSPFVDPVTDDSESDVDGFHVIHGSREPSDLQATMSDRNIGLNDGFEIISPLSGVKVSDAESEPDIDPIINIGRSEVTHSQQMLSLPLRTKPASAPDVRVDAAESSDSEWSYI